jgi:uncharacterized protein YndB with AHSA1/START domain
MQRSPISDAAVKKATGKDRAQWFALLDKAGAKKMSHKEIAQWLQDNHIKKGWWAQMVTVEYEYARGKRVIGKTESAGFQIGVQKALPISQRQAWQLITKKGRKLWLGDSTDVRFTKGATYTTREGTQGEVRSIVPGEKLRLSWRPKSFAKPSTVQINLMCHRNTPGKTVISIHQEKLASAREREVMRKRWRRALQQFEKLI